MQQKQVLWIGYNNNSSNICTIDSNEVHPEVGLHDDDDGGWWPFDRSASTQDRICCFSVWKVSHHQALSRCPPLVGGEPRPVVCLSAPRAAASHETSQSVSPHH